jgi:hypothetical protein
MVLIAIIIVRPCTERLQKHVPADLCSARRLLYDGRTLPALQTPGGGGHFPLSQALGIPVFRDMGGHCN